MDPDDPDLWYVSAERSAREAHRNDGRAAARLYRRRGAAPWQALGGDGTGLPAPLHYMPYALLTPRGRPSSLLAGLQHGELYLSEDAGDSWRRLDLKLPRLMALSAA